jgi:hypothetical protein
MNITQRRIGLFLAEDPKKQGACYTFLFGDVGVDQLFGRLYERAMQRAEILHRVDRSKKIRYFRNVPYKSEMFRTVVGFFLAQFGVREVHVMLVKGKLEDATFVPVDLKQCAEEGASPAREKKG